MTSPFVTTNVFLINLAVLLLTTSLVGGCMSILWLGIGNLLERIGFVNIVFELLKMAIFFYCFPMVYILLKIFETDLGRGYLFLPTKRILVFVIVFLVIQCLGSLTMLVYISHDIRKLTKKYEDSFRGDLEMQSVFEKVLDELHLGTKGKRMNLRLKQSYRAQVPCITGILNPTIILPVKKYSREELRYILMHEIMHYKQGDLLLKRVSIIVCIVHFYNPLSWLLLFNIQKWSEYACDYRVCAHNRKIHEYFEVLICNAVEEGVRSRLTSCLVENQHELVERVKKMKMVYGKKRSKVSAAIILCLMFGLSTMTVCAVTLESAEQYVEVKRETTEDTRQEKDKQHVEFVEEGKTPGIQVVQGQINEVARSQHTFNWVVNGNTMMKGPYFHCNAGGLVAFSVNILPTSVTVNVGIESSSGKRQYLYCNAEESYVFNISDADDYFFFVENTSNVAVTVTGGYLIP